MSVRYKKAPPSEQKLPTFLDREFERIQSALRNVDADTLQVSGGPSFFASQIALMPGTRTLGNFFTPQLGYSGAAASNGIYIQDAGPSGISVLASFDRYSASTTLPPFALFRKSHSDTLGVQSAVQAAEALGVLAWHGSDGTNFLESARIQANTVGAASAGVPASAEYSSYVVPTGGGSLMRAIQWYAPGGFAQLNAFDSAGNFLATMGGVNSHGGFAAASVGGSSYSIFYMYSQNYATIRAYLGHNGSALELLNNLSNLETDLITTDNTATRRSNIRLGGNFAGSALAFHGTAPILKPTATGAKGGNAALASICTILANYGLIVDSTT